MHARRSSSLVAALVVVGLAVAACGGTAPTPSAGVASSPQPVATTAPTPAAPTASPTEAPSNASSAAPGGSPTAGRTGRIEIADEQVALTLPEGWTEVVLSGDDVDAIIENFPEGTFSEEQLAAMKAAIGTGMKLMAFDTDGRGSNVNLLVQPTEIPLDLLSSALEGQLSLIPGASGVKIEETEVDGETGLRATYDLDQPVAGGSPVAMTGTQLYVSTNGRLYVFTVTLADGSTVEPDDILGTIEFLD